MPKKYCILNNTKKLISSTTQIFEGNSCIAKMEDIFEQRPIKVVTNTYEVDLQDKKGKIVKVKIKNAEVYYVDIIDDYTPKRRYEWCDVNKPKVSYKIDCDFLVCEFIH